MVKRIILWHQLALMFIMTIYWKIDLMNHLNLEDKIYYYVSGFNELLYLTKQNHDGVDNQMNMTPYYYATIQSERPLINNNNETNIQNLQN